MSTIIIAGVGNITRERLGKALCNVSTSGVVAEVWVTDTELERATALRERFPDLRLKPALPDDPCLLRELVEGKIDFVHIVTPPQSHLDLVREFAGYVPLVLCDKPLCFPDEVDRAKALLRCLKALGCLQRLVVADHYLLRPEIRVALQAIRRRGHRAKSVTYVSFEHQLLWLGATFAAGYLCEHLVHAAGVAWFLGADLTMISPDAVKQAKLWRYELPTDTNALPRKIDRDRDDTDPQHDTGGWFSATLPTVAGGRLKLDARCAKGCPRDLKHIEVGLEDGSIVRINLDRHTVTYPEGWGRPPYDASEDQDPYDVMYEQALKGDIVAGVLPFEQAIGAVELMGAAVTEAGPPSAYLVPPTLPNYPFPDGTGVPDEA